MGILHCAPPKWTVGIKGHKMVMDLLSSCPGYKLAITKDLMILPVQYTIRSSCLPSHELHQHFEFCFTSRLRYTCSHFRWPSPPILLPSYSFFFSTPSDQHHLVARVLGQPFFCSIHPFIHPVKGFIITAAAATTQHSLLQLLLRLLLP